MSPRTLKDLLIKMLEKNASDIHFSAHVPPRVRLDGELLPMEGEEGLSPEECERLCLEMLSEHQRQQFKEKKELDFSFGLPGLSRFRGNIYLQRDTVAGAFRALPWKIPSIETLGLPERVKELATYPNGLVLVTGATGSGKSTTIASILNEINKTRKEHLMTIEDPIEFIFEDGTCMIHQREAGQDSHSFHAALKSLLRQDPDIVLIGEMRDLETIQAAITTAETGHLVFATVHTNNAVQTVDRIIDVFPSNQQPQIRSQLAFVLSAVLCQQLLPVKGGGRRLALEMMFPNYAIRNLIREGKTHQIHSLMQTGQEKSGMKTMTQSLVELLKDDHINIEAALEYAHDREDLEQQYRRFLAQRAATAQGKK